MPSTPDYDYELYTLTQDFYQDYPPSQYPELLSPSGNRTYNCFVLEFRDYFVCIPFRTNMRHRNGYHFRNSLRSRNNRSGLDYSKMVIIRDTNRYLSNSHTLVDNDEYRETLSNLDRIARQVSSYLDDYINHQNGVSRLNPHAYRQKYQYSTLQYFHSIIF